MRHYLLTRAAYGPDVPLAFNRRRLALTRGITARSLASQTTRDVTWLVLIDPADPLLAKREAVLRSSGLPVVTAPAGNLIRDHRYDRPWGPWSSHLPWRDDSILSTRIDDDDAFAPWALMLYRAEAERWEEHRRRRVILTMPSGWRANRGRANRREDRHNQFASLYAPRGDKHSIMDINHTSIERIGRLIAIETDPAWLWLRHKDARSSMSRATNLDADSMDPIGDDLRAQFDVDWSLV